MPHFQTIPIVENCCLRGQEAAIPPSRLRRTTVRVAGIACFAPFRRCRDTCRAPASRRSRKEKSRRLRRDPSTKAHRLCLCAFSDHGAKPPGGSAGGKGILKGRRPLSRVQRQSLCRESRAQCSLAEVQEAESPARGVGDRVSNQRPLVTARPEAPPQRRGRRTHRRRRGQ